MHATHGTLELSFHTLPSISKLLFHGEGGKFGGAEVQHDSTVDLNGVHLEGADRLEGIVADVTAKRRC